MKITPIRAVAGSALVIIALGIVLTVDVWREPLAEVLWPPKLDANGWPITELVVREPVLPYPEATTVKLFVRSAEDMGEWLVEGRVLSRDERIAIEGHFRRSGYRHLSYAACFIPHHFLHYYNEAGDEVGRVEVCFCCTGAAASPELFPRQGGFIRRYENELEFDVEGLRATFEDMGVRTDMWCGRDD